MDGCPKPLTRNLAPPAFGLVFALPLRSLQALQSNVTTFSWLPYEHLAYNILGATNTSGSTKHRGYKRGSSPAELHG